MEPITFDWTPRPATLDATGSEALDVAPGRYRIIAVDAEGARADILVDVEPILDHGAVIVSEYRTTPASSNRARDGSVEVIGAGVDGRRFLWTHGAVTNSAVLRDVPAGEYTAFPLPHADDAAPTLVHRCAPGRVGVRPASE
jgi:hypothetical protein